jgi:hypothetical protein
MDAFKKLFGVEKSGIKPHCIVSPLNEAVLFSGLKLGERAHGDYFRVVDSQYATIIGTHYSLLAGDCVISLADSPCRNVYLFGCCGAVGVEVGARLLVKKAFNFESFSDMLEGKAVPSCQGPDRELAEEFSGHARGGFLEGTCASVGSLALEEAYLPRFRALGVNCLDMECSAVFSAAKSSGKRALALLYASGRIPDKPWHESLDRRDIQRLGQSRKDLASLLARFIQRQARE